jgi:hypothetical protein
MRRSRFARSQGRVIGLGILCVVALITVLQLWLLTATMNAHLGEDDSILLPAALASLFCFALNAGLFFYLSALER